MISACHVKALRSLRLCGEKIVPICKGTDNRKVAKVAKGEEDDLQVVM